MTQPDEIEPAELAKIDTLAISHQSPGSSEPSLEMAKLPVPGAEPLQMAMDLLRHRVRGELGGSADDSQKSRLARQLLEEAIKERDSVARYVTLQLAMDLACQAGDAATMDKSINRMEFQYEVDIISLVKQFDEFVEHRFSKAELDEALKRISFRFVKATQSDEYLLASELGKVALKAAEKANQSARRDRIAVRLSELEELHIKYDSIKAYISKLKEDPANPAANSIVG
ncbi:MAG: hypothetical protein N2C12_09765, partial [Planctomycetales bacterium]